MSTRFPGRRLSWLRLSIGVIVIAALAGTGVLGWNRVQDARAVEGRSSWFAGYVDATVTPFYPIENPSHDASASIILSFIVADPEESCSPSWGGFYQFNDAEATMDLDRQIARLRDAGGEVAASFGGLLNAELATVCRDDEDLLDAYRQVVERYDLSMVDLDIEGEALADHEATARRATAISQLVRERAEAGRELDVWLTLPADPQGLTPDGVETVRAMLEAEVPLNGVNIMTMNYGGSRAAGDSMLEASIAAARATHGQVQALYAEAGLEAGDRTTWSRIGLTPMVGQNDVPEDIFTLEDAAGLNAFAREMGVGRMSMWSLNRDATCSANYGDTTRVSNECSGVEQDGRSFAAVLGEDLGLAPIGAAEDAPAASATASATAAADTAAASRQAGAGELVIDDPETSPYPIWSEQAAYVQGDRIVWQRKVYSAKWWTQGDVPDDPLAAGEATPWRLIGPVLPGETPQPVVTAPADAVAAWSADTVYQQGDHVQLEGRVFRSKWWTQGDSPEAALQGAQGSPWTILRNDEVTALLERLESEPSASPTGG